MQREFYKLQIFVFVLFILKYLKNFKKSLINTTRFESLKAVQIIVWFNKY